jgi:hydrogenase small subunit
LKKGSVFKTMKYLGFLPQDVPQGESKLLYWFKAGVGKITPSPAALQEHSK